MPLPQSSNRVEGPANVFLARMGDIKVALRSVIGSIAEDCRRSLGDIVAVAARTAGGAKAMFAGFLCAPGTGLACSYAVHTISLRTGWADLISLGIAAATKGACSRTGSTTPTESACQFIPRICTQRFPHSSHRSMSTLTTLSAAWLPAAY